MQKTVRSIVLLGLLFSFMSVSAQELTKKEKCDIKKELKHYRKNPEQYVAMKQKQVDDIKALQEEVDALKAKLNQAQKTQDSLKVVVATVELKYSKLLDSMPSIVPPKGTVYQVQMGYYQQLDLVSFNNKLKVIKAEESGGAKRYVIGYFDQALDAIQFASDMKALGINDAFVTQYVDGIRNMDYDAFKALGN